MHNKIDEIKTKEDFIRFVDEMRLLYNKNNSLWINRDLPSYFEAMSEWVSDMEGYFENIDEQPPEKPTWRLFAQILAASMMYE